MFTTLRQTESTPQQSSAATTVVETVVSRLREIGVNFVAIDFDFTMVDIHTGGAWRGTAEELVPHVRPEFRQLLAALTTTTTSADHAQPFAVAICTFSPQTSLIRQVVTAIVGDEVATRIPIRGGDRSWTYTPQATDLGHGGNDDSVNMMKGKQAHMASAVEELLTIHDNLDITRATSILIDDDVKNVKAALKHGVRAVWFLPEKPHRLWKDLAKMK